MSNIQNNHPVMLTSEEQQIINAYRRSLEFCGNKPKHVARATVGLLNLFEEQTPRELASQLASVQNTMIFDALDLELNAPLRGKLGTMHRLASFLRGKFQSL